MIDKKVIEEVRQYINARLIVCDQEIPLAPKAGAIFGGSLSRRKAAESVSFNECACDDLPAPCMSVSAAREELLSRLAERDESFSEYLLGIIDAAGMTDVECYTKAQITRQLFNRIKNTKDYRPAKNTVIALAFALELPEENFRGLLNKAGYSLSHASRFDLIVEYCVTHGIYKIDDVNELLFSFDQPLLGSK